MFYCYYIDDLLFICSGGLGTLESLLDYLNGNHLNVKCTGQINYEPVSFLDVTLWPGGRIITAVYRKILSCNTVLWADSGHPGHTSGGLPVGQFLRLAGFVTMRGT